MCKEMARGTALSKNLKSGFVGKLSLLGLTVMLAGCQTTEQGWFMSPQDEAEYASLESRSAIMNEPSLVVSDEPAEVIYQRGSRDTVYMNSDAPMVAKASKSYGKVETLVTRKIKELRGDLVSTQKAVSKLSGRLDTLQASNEAEASSYYKQVALISSDLQAGTTPGNPELIERWNFSQEKLSGLADGTRDLNDLATDIASQASVASFLLEGTRATFGLSGAVKADHENLVALEDEVNQLIVHIDRLLNAVNDEMNRRTTFLRSERLNMQTLSLSIARGELYGQNITNRLFKRAEEALRGETVATPPVAASNRPLVVIRFDQANVDYEQPVFSAVSQALEKYPGARFNLVAVSPETEGNAAQTALASTHARRNGENVLRSLSRMGVPMERIDLSSMTSHSAQTSEVHIFIQ